MSGTRSASTFIRIRRERVLSSFFPAYPITDVHFLMLSSSEAIAARVIEIIAKYKNLPESTVTPASTFEELQIDSLDKINLTFEVEEVFKISIPDESLNTLRTVGDVITGVTTLQAAKPAES